mgnify:CR=1 FL=1
MRLSVASASNSHRAGDWMSSVLDRLRQMLARRHINTLPPMPSPKPAPRIHTTPLAERQRIDQRLQGVQSRIAVLLAEVGLEERRTRGKDSSHHAI